MDFRGQGTRGQADTVAAAKVAGLAAKKMFLTYKPAAIIFVTFSKIVFVLLTLECR